MLDTLSLKMYDSEGLMSVMKVFTYLKAFLYMADNHSALRIQTLHELGCVFWKYTNMSLNDGSAIW